MIRHALVAALAAAALSQPALAQDELHLRQKLEGKRMVVQIDMPATSEGVDVFPGSSRPLDFQKYSGRLKNNGMAIPAGQSSMITKIKVKSDNIEIHLGGGGYGTLGDWFSSTMRNNGADSGAAQQARIANERVQRAASGSRFNLRYPNGMTPEDLTVESIVRALQEYATIPSLQNAAQQAPLAPASQGAVAGAPQPYAQPAPQAYPPQQQPQYPAAAPQTQYASYSAPAQAPAPSPVAAPVAQPAAATAPAAAAPAPAATETPAVPVLPLPTT